MARFSSRATNLTQSHACDLAQRARPKLTLQGKCRRLSSETKKGRPECSGFREEMVKKCFSTSSELGHNSPRLQRGTSCIEAVLCSGAATERQPLRFVVERMVLFFGQIFRSERTLT